MPTFENLDFLNANTLRSYPIKEGLSRVSTDGILVIPDTFLVDFMLAATSDVTKRFYVSRIISSPTEIIVVVSDDANTVIGQFNIVVSSHTRYKDYYMQPADAQAGANGRLTVGYVDNLLEVGAGTFFFTLATAEFESRCIIPCLATVNRFIFTDNNLNTVSLSGDVKILGRNNIRFTDGAQDDTVPDDVVVMDVGEGLGLNKKCDETAPCIQTINNVPPDDNGNFNITTSDCANITATSIPPGIVLSDTCCKPCMGCNEISVLTDRLIQLETDLLKLRDHYNNLQTLIQEFSTLMSYSCECA